METVSFSAEMVARVKRLNTVVLVACAVVLEGQEIAVVCEMCAQKGLLVKGLEDSCSVREGLYPR